MKGQYSMILEQSKQKSNEGFSSTEIVAYLHDQDMTITQSIQIVGSVFRMSLTEAKQTVSQHPIWNEEVQIADRLHS